MSYSDIRYSPYVFSNHMLDEISVKLCIIDLCQIVTCLRVIGEHSELADYLDKHITQYFDSFSEYK